MLYLTLISSLIAAIALDQVCLFQAGDNLLYAIFTQSDFGSEFTARQAGIITEQL